MSAATVMHLFTVLILLGGGVLAAGVTLLALWGVFRPKPQLALKGLVFVGLAFVGLAVTYAWLFARLLIWSGGAGPS